MHATRGHILNPKEQRSGVAIYTECNIDISIAQHSPIQSNTLSNHAYIVTHKAISHNTIC